MNLCRDKAAFSMYLSLMLILLAPGELYAQPKDAAKNSVNFECRKDLTLLLMAFQAPPAPPKGMHSPGRNLPRLEAEIRNNGDSACEIVHMGCSYPDNFEIDATTPASLLRTTIDWVCLQNTPTVKVVKPGEFVEFKIPVEPSTILKNGQQLSLTLRFKSMGELGRTAFSLESKLFKTKYARYSGKSVK